MALYEAPTNVLGLPIEGDPEFSRSHGGEQWGEDEFAGFIRPLQDSDSIEAVRWTQYTPFFNDGDVCEFGVGEVTFKIPGVTVEDDEDDDYPDGFLNTYDHQIKGGRASRYLQRDTDAWAGRWEEYGPHSPQHDDYEAMREFDANLYHFENFLYNHFGDHATVTVYKDRILVEYYTHD